MSTERETLENAFKDIGDISGMTVFDAGPEGIISRYLAERIGDGRVIGVNIWLEAYQMVRKRVGDELMGKVVFVKDDMRKIDYLKDNFFDLVVSYDTLAAIEGMTPGGTLPILYQFYRILKRGKWFLAVEHPLLVEVKPINKAQELELEFRRILSQLWGVEFGKGTYRPSQLSEILGRIGFKETYWKTVSQAPHITTGDVTEMFQGIRNLANKTIRDEKEKGNTLREIDDIFQKGEESGFCEPPYYALYAKKP